MNDELSKPYFLFKVFPFRGIVVLTSFEHPSTNVFCWSFSPTNVNHPIYFVYILSSMYNYELGLAIKLHPNKTGCIRVQTFPS